MGGARPQVSLFVGALLFMPVAVALLPEDPSTDPAVVGRWVGPFEGEVAAVNLVVLHTGEVLYWTGVEAGDRDNLFFLEGALNAEARLFDPTTLAVTDLTDPSESHGVDLFCSGNTVLPDGRVLTAGSSQWTGLLVDGTPLHGGPESFLFDPVTRTWERAPDMAVGRWYPSLITTPEGDGLVASGIGALANPLEHRELIERFHDHDEEVGEVDHWHAETERLLPLYPRIHVVPGGPLKGQLFYQPVGTMWGPFGEHPLEALWNFQQVYDGNEWAMLGASKFGVRQHGAVVPLVLEPERAYAPELVTFGGSHLRSLVATPLTEIADLASAEPENHVAHPMAFPRWHLNGVLAPDGAVYAVGGGLYDTVYLHGQPNIPVMPAERFDPATGRWTTMAAMTVERMYHSTAVLLPDGRILAGGHVTLPIPWKDARDNVPIWEQIVETRFEIFEPPYLHWGARPVIENAPAQIVLDTTFVVELDDAEAISDVVLMRPGATTHAFDADQRGIRLEVLQVNGASDTIQLQAPPDATVAPPGYYMLFVLSEDEEGRGLIPSEAAWVRVHSTAP